MQLVSMRLLLPVFLLSTAPAQAFARNIQCAPGNNAAIQACLDEAEDGDQVSFRPGVFTIDPDLPPVKLLNRGGLTLRAQNKNKPPEFECAHVGEANHERPSQLTEADSAFNVVVSDGSTVSPITFENLVFRYCYTAIWVRAAGTAPLGRFADVQVRGVDVSKGIFGISLQNVDRATVANNVVSQTERSIFIGGASPRAAHVEATGNELSGPTEDYLPTAALVGNMVGIETQNVEGIVSDNAISGFTRAKFVGGRAIVHSDVAPGSFDLSSTDNQLIGNQNGIGVGGTGQATGVISGNTITDCTRYGISMVRFGNGWTVGPNEFANNAWGDIYLLGPLGNPTISQGPNIPTHDNTVIAYPGTNVIDEGINNTIIWLPAP